MSTLVGDRSGFVPAIANPASPIPRLPGHPPVSAPQHSMFSHRDLGIYLTIVVVILLGVLLSVSLLALMREDPHPCGSFYPIQPHR